MNNKIRRVAGIFGSPKAIPAHKNVPKTIRLTTENDMGNKNKRKKIENFRKNLFLIFIFFIFLLNNLTIPSGITEVRNIQYKKSSKNKVGIAVF